MADIWEEGARQVSEQYGIPKYVTDYKDLIASPDVEAVLICSPTDQVSVCLRREGAAWRGASDQKKMGSSEGQWGS